MILPYPVAYVEDGIMLFYFTDENNVNKKYSIIPNDRLNDICCVSGNFGVSLSLINKIDLVKDRTTIYFMRYDFRSVVADYIGSFTVDEQFIIDMKVQLKLHEIQQSAQELKLAKNSISDHN